MNKLKKKTKEKETLLSANFITKDGLEHKELDLPESHPGKLSLGRNVTDTNIIPHEDRLDLDGEDVAGLFPEVKKEVFEPTTGIQDKDKNYILENEITNLVEDVQKTKETPQIINANDLVFTVTKKEPGDRVEIIQDYPAKVFPEPKNKAFIEKIDEIWSETSSGMSFHHLYTEDFALDGREIHIKGQKVLNFGSCSYLGLEHHPKLKEGAIEAIQRYGTQYSSSITYLSLGLYKELKEKYTKIFGSNVVLAPTTTLAHASSIPLIADEHDVFLLDQQVHNSVQMGTQLAAAQGTPFFIMPHNNIEALEDKIQKLKNEHRKIWYFLDGVYSMYGDLAPIAELEKLRDKYDNLYLYIDDAHGTSWRGKNGKGHALSCLKSLRKTIVAVSNNKAFAGAGGSLVIEDPELYNVISNFGQTMIFGGPIQPANLGACLASADIHLSKEIYVLQDKLRSKIDLRNRLFDKYDIPVFGDRQTPISFICVGSPKSLGILFHKLFEDGIYTNCAVYPAVSKQKSGLRTTMTNHLTDADIEKFVERVAYHLPKILQEEGSSIEKIKKRFKIKERNLVKV
jgi:7-keto-8-aminopelargonate synthetase-like enzyme